MNVSIGMPTSENAVALGRQAKFSHGDTILPRGGCDHCHLITKGAVSIRFGSRAIEVDLIGPGELLNIGAILGTDANEHFAVALTDCETFTFPTETLKSLTSQSPLLHPRLLHYVQTRLVQAMRAAECHLTHLAERRLACWIAIATDTLGESEIAVTHAELSTALGVRRPTVTLALQQLEGYRAIRSRRGRVIVRDHDLLLAHACSCFAARHATREIPPVGLFLTRP
jgi:CRP-like cAMP-binding protein